VHASPTWFFQKLAYQISVFWQAVQPEVQSPASVPGNQPTSPVKTRSGSLPANSVAIAPAVPSALFTSHTQPKIATPPTRTRKESSDIPEIRHSGSHELARNPLIRSQLHSS